MPTAKQFALLQFDSVPEKMKDNLDEMERLARAAVTKGARWMIFHEGCLTDYTPRVDEVAESVPNGLCVSNRKMLISTRFNSRRGNRS